MPESIVGSARIAAEDLAAQFQELWQQRPDVVTFLHGADSATVQEIVAVVRVDQQERWARGERILVDWYFDRLPALRRDTEALLDSIYSEVVWREDQGERPALAEYLERFPELDCLLRRQWALHEGLKFDADEASVANAPNTAVETLRPGENNTDTATEASAAAPRIAL